MTNEQLTELRLALGLLGDAIGSDISDATIYGFVAEAHEKVGNVVHQLMTAVEPKALQVLQPDCVTPVPQERMHVIMRSFVHALDKGDPNYIVDCDWNEGVSIINELMNARHSQNRPAEPSAPIDAGLRYKPVLERASNTREGWTAEMEQAHDGEWVHISAQNRQAEPTADARDAARYRWLRSDEGYFGPKAYADDDCNTWLQGEQLDKAVDAAITSGNEVPPALSKTELGAPHIHAFDSRFGVCACGHWANHFNCACGGKTLLPAEKCLYCGAENRTLPHE